VPNKAEFLRDLACYAARRYLPERRATRVRIVVTNVATLPPELQYSKFPPPRTHFRRKLFDYEVTPEDLQ
jgi:hypothetical protein